MTTSHCENCSIKFQPARAGTNGNRKVQTGTMTSGFDMDDQAVTFTAHVCQRCGQSFMAASEASPAPKYCSPKCAGSASSAKRKGKPMGRRKDEGNQDTAPASGPSLADTVDQLIRDGYLPAPTLRLAFDDTPVWGFGAIASLFELRADQLIAVIRQNGPNHLPDDRGIPSSWALLETFKL